MSAKPNVIDKDFPGQHDGEQVEWLFRQHPLVMRKALVMGLLAITLAVLPLDFAVVYTMPVLLEWLTRLAVTMPLVVLVGWLYRWVGWYYSVFIVTNERLIIIQQKGLFDRQVQEWQLENIMNVNYRIGGFQAALFGFGDISMQSYVGDVTLPIVHKPAEVHDKLLAAVRKAGGGGSTQPAPIR